MRMLNLRFSLPVVFSAFLPHAAAPPLPAGHRWSTYTSSDSAYQQCYPADLLQPKAGAGPDLSLTGSHHETAEISRPVGSVQDALRTESDWFNQGGGEITYVSKGTTWFVFSGIDKEGQFTEAGGTVYERGVMIGTDIVSIRLAYPKYEAAVFDPIGATMGKCLAKANKR